MNTPPQRTRQQENEVLRDAVGILEKRLVWGTKRIPIKSQKDAARYFWLQLAPRTREAFAVALIDAKGKLIKYQELFAGSLSETKVYIREVARYALLNNACSVVVAHNHPSGDAAPSREDLELSKRLASALKLVGIRLLDSFVVGEDVVSIRDVFDTTAGDSDTAAQTAEKRIDISNANTVPHLSAPFQKSHSSPSAAVPEPGVLRTPLSDVPELLQ